MVDTPPYSITTRFMVGSSSTYYYLVHPARRGWRTTFRNLSMSGAQQVTLSTLSLSRSRSRSRSQPRPDPPSLLLPSYPQEARMPIRIPLSLISCTLCDIQKSTFIDGRLLLAPVQAPGDRRARRPGCATHAAGFHRHPVQESMLRAQSRSA